VAGGTPAYAAPMADLWTTIAAERGALADDLGGLTDEQWHSTSLCDSWTVEEVVAHMASTAQLTPPKFIAGFAGSGFNFPRFSAKGIAAQRGSIPLETLANFRKLQDSRKSPPGPKTTWLGETIIHAEDIRRPLGIAHVYDPDSVRAVGDFYKGSNTLIGAKDRIAGLRLTATDVDWTHGDGPEVSGPMLSLVLAMTGRAPGCDDLTGPGVDTLRSRCL
jgi:uncharacterized protein (TIGR03083 family)